MPSRPRKPCGYFGCKELVRVGTKYCDEHKKQHKKDYTKKDYSKLYSMARWRKSRIYFLRANPLCIICEKNGVVKPAGVVDHIIPHKGNMKLFWDSENWQSLCNICHNSKTAKEDGGFGNYSKFDGGGA